MGYKIKKLKYKRRSWKVQYVSYKGDKETTKDLDPTQCLKLGFNEQMSVEQAVARKDQLNAQEELKRTEELRLRVKVRTDHDDLVINANLPESDILEFEQKRLFNRALFNPADVTRTEKAKSHWRKARKAIAGVNLPPQQWLENAGLFYDFFSLNKYSFSYLQKVLRLINLWGKYCAGKYNFHFDPIPLPKGKERQSVITSYHKKRKNGLASNPLTPEMLESKQQVLKLENYNWLYISVWLGLRPEEVDKIGTAEVLYDEEAKEKVIKVYQPKLEASLDYEQRFKYIPLRYKQQLRVLDIIKQGKIKRPLVKTLKLHFGERVTLYAGRKYFEALMLRDGVDYQDISKWMGHQTVDRTWRNYRDRQQRSKYRKVS